MTVQSAVDWLASQILHVGCIVHSFGDVGKCVSHPGSNDVDVSHRCTAGGLDRALLCQSLTMLPRAMIMSGNTSSGSTSRSPLLTTKKLIRNVRIGTTNGSRSIWYGDIERSGGDWPLAAAPPERMSSPFHTRHITMPPAFDLLLPLAYCMLLTVGWHANEIESKVARWQNLIQGKEGIKFCSIA